MRYIITILALMCFSCTEEMPLLPLPQAPRSCQTCTKIWVYDVGKRDTMLKPTEYCGELPPWVYGDTGRYSSPTSGGWRIVTICK